MSQTAPIAPTRKTPSVAVTALIFAAVGPAAGPFLFALVLAVAGLWNIGPGSILVGAGYFIWFLPFFYVALAIPFALTGIAYAIAARRLARPSLLMALIAGAVVLAALLSLLYLAGWLATLAGYDLPNTSDDLYEVSEIVSNTATLAGVMVIGVIPSWWFTRDRSAPPRWI